MRSGRVLLPMVLLLSSVGQAATLPAGTVVYGELVDEVISKKKFNHEGDYVEAVVWRDVVVGGVVVLPGGSPMVVRISRLKKANFAGIKGKLELEAVSATAPDGTEIPLDGGYDKSGRGRKALSIRRSTSETRLPERSGLAQPLSPSK